MQIDTLTSLLVDVMEHAPHPIFVTRTGGAIVYANPAALHVFQVDRAKAGERSLDRYFVKVDGGLSLKDLFDKLHRGETADTPADLAGEQGSTASGRVVSFRLEEAGADPMRCVFMFLDGRVHVARQMEEAVKKNLDMARINSELIRSNTELRRLSEMKSSFLSIASHELKTPLTSIKGYSDIIMDTMRDRLDPTVLRMVENINRAADRLHKVVNAILDVTRIDQKRLRLQPEFVDVTSVVKEAIDELADMYTSRKIVFRCDFQKGLPQLYGDKIRMHQVFTNLFSNAVKFSPDGSEVEVAIACEEDGMFHITVSDQGIGIEKADQKRIFEPFFEVAKANRHSTHASRFMGAGTGLGLSIVKGIVEFHRGRIWVESEGTSATGFPGSTFHIHLPAQALLVPTPQDTDPLLNVMKEDATSADDTLAILDEKPKVLLIDSDHESNEAARRVLDSVFEVLVAPTGEEGLALAFAHTPSLILLESRLPKLDGYRVCRILRSQEETRSIPVAFVSSATGEEEIQRCFSCGADDFVVKPLTGSELVDKIWRILMKKKEDVSFKTG